jgi:polar amino acid transport system substrate-binding protein
MSRGALAKEEQMSLRGRIFAGLAIVTVIAGVVGCGSSSSTPSNLLDKVTQAKKFVVSTDPKYPPQSELKADGTYEGFDIEVAREIAKRLGGDAEFTPQDWNAITAGGWGGRWDASVGSMAITPDRAKVLDFSPPYYYTPAQMATHPDSGITTLEGFSGKTVCSGQGTTYDTWLSGKLDFGIGTKPAPPPANVTPTTLETDRDCADAWKSGRFDFDGWLSSSTTVQGAIDAGLPVVKVGDPVFFEPLAVATDKLGPDTKTFMTKLDEIVKAMHDDGTLSALSMKWLGEDLTKANQ